MVTHFNKCHNRKTQIFIDFIQVFINITSSKYILYYFLLENDKIQYPWRYNIQSTRPKATVYKQMVFRFNHFYLFYHSSMNRHTRHWRRPPLYTLFKIAPYVSKFNWRGEKTNQMERMNEKISKKYVEQLDCTFTL